jgi:hypothetical protein
VLQASGRRVRAAHSYSWWSQDSDYVVAVRNFLPEDPTLLAFHKGDIIHLQPLEPPRVGQCHVGKKGVDLIRGGWARGILGRC